MLKGNLDPDALIVDYNSGEIGVGELCNVGTTAIRLLIVTPQGKRLIKVEDARTYSGVISKPFADWLSKKYQVLLQEVENNFFIVKSPYHLPNQN